MQGYGGQGKTNGWMEEMTYNFSLSLGELGLGFLELLSLSLPDVLRLLGLLSLAIMDRESKKKEDKVSNTAPGFQNGDETRFPPMKELTGKRWKRR